MQVFASITSWSRFPLQTTVFLSSRGKMSAGGDVSLRLSLVTCPIPLFLAVQDLDEGLPELHVEGGVYDGIHSTVYVAQPSERVVHFSRDLAFSAMSVQDMGDEEWQPANDEYTWRDKGEEIKMRGWKKGGGNRRDSESIKVNSNSKNIGDLLDMLRCGFIASDRWTLIHIRLLDNTTAFSFDCLVLFVCKRISWRSLESFVFLVVSSDLTENTTALEQTVLSLDAENRHLQNTKTVSPRF